MAKTFLLFDIDGTLLHSNKIDSECFAQTFENQFGKPFPSIDWQTYPHVTDHVIFNEVIRQHFNRDASMEDIRVQRDNFVALLESKRQSNPEDFQEIPGAVEMINSLHQNQDFVLGIATGGWKAPARVKLNHLKIEEERFFASYADGMPSREAILSEAIAKARTVHNDISRVVYIGDAVWDVRTTLNMQLDFVGVRRRGDIDFLKAKGAQIVIKDYQDYNVFLEAVNKAVPPKGF